jgi:glycosyltransferase involved in cell wall biosynthesis
MSDVFEILRHAQIMYWSSDFLGAVTGAEKYRSRIVHGHQRCIATIFGEVSSCSRPMLSIVIVSHRDVHVLAECVESILKQIDFENAFPAFEFIVVDVHEGRCLEATLENIGATGKVVHVGVNILPAEARNIGAKQASGKWLYFIDDDAILLTKISDFANIVASTSRLAIRGRVVPRNMSYESPPHYDLGSTVIPSELITEGNLLILAPLYFAVGGFDPLMYGHEGKDLTRRCRHLINIDSMVYDPRLLISHDPTVGDKLNEKAKRNMIGTKYMKHKEMSVIDVPRGICFCSNFLPAQLDAYLNGYLSQQEMLLDFVIFAQHPHQAIFQLKKHAAHLKFTVLPAFSESCNHIEYSRYAYAMSVQGGSQFEVREIKTSISESLSKGGSQSISGNSGVLGHVVARTVDENWWSSAETGWSGNVVPSLLQSTRVMPIMAKRTTDDSLTRDDLLITSFYTDDAYYSGKAKELIFQLDALGIRHDIRKFSIPEGSSWAEVCRKKVNFYYELFLQHRNRCKKIIWIDVDCKINYLPSLILDFDVDFMAFRRGFPHSSHAEKTRTRHWEPCFFVFKTNDACLKLISEADRIERENPQISATDDYFFEESWRVNHINLTTFEIPGEMSSRGYKKEFMPIEARKNGVFFNFGESGKVAEFKGKVVQHEANAQVTSTKLAMDSHAAPPKDPIQYLIKISSGSKNSLKSVEQTFAKQCDENSRELVRSLRSYELGGPTIPLFWWIRPAPGNMGDWLSPYIINKLTGYSVGYAGADSAKLISLGSIGRYTNEKHVVWGTGISGRHTPLNAHAKYLAVRGPYTAESVQESGGVAPEIFGDPGILMQDIYQAKSKPEKGRYGLVRHFVHQDCKLNLSDDICDINIMLSSTEDIENFVEQINKCEAVVTTSLHVMILCHSYKIPCRLIDIPEDGRSVHGDGIKYKDFYEGAGVKYLPHVDVGRKLTGIDICSIVSDDFASLKTSDDLKNSLLTPLRRYPEVFVN